MCCVFVIIAALFHLLSCFFWVLYYHYLTGKSFLYTFQVSFGKMSVHSPWSFYRNTFFSPISIIFLLRQEGYFFSPRSAFLAALRMATSRQSQTFHQSEWASAHTSGSKVFCPLSPSDPFTTMLPTHTGACLYELEISWDSGSQVVSSSQRRQCLCPQRVSVNTTLNWKEI